MPRNSTNAPQFKSEAEEANWYSTAEGRAATQREFVRALREGALMHSTGSKISKTDPALLSQVMEQAKESATAP